MLAGGTETRTVHDPCVLLISLPDTFFGVQFLFVLSVSYDSLVRPLPLGSSKSDSQSVTHHGSGACVTESMSVAHRSCDVRRTQQRADELSAHSCGTGRTGSTVAADDGNSSTDRTGRRVITELGQRH